MDNTEVLTNKIEKEINKNNHGIQMEYYSKKEDKYVIITTAVLYAIYLSVLPFITNYLTTNSVDVVNIHNIAINTKVLVYSVLGIPPAVPIALFELSFYKNIKETNKKIEALNDNNKYLEEEKNKIKEHKKEFSKIKSRVDLHYVCVTNEHKYLKLYKKGKLNKKLQKNYSSEDIMYVDEYIENHNKIKVKQI